ncbi:MAG: hypothetical protein ACRERU_10245, partial [Methylococcales bacterium]
FAKQHYEKPMPAGRTIVMELKLFVLSLSKHERPMSTALPSACGSKVRQTPSRGVEIIID